MTLVFDDFHESLLIGGHILLTHFWRDASSLLHAIGLKFCKVWRPTFLNMAFQQGPEVFNRVEVQGLAGPLEDIDMVCPEPCRHPLCLVLGVIVMLEHEMSPQTQLTC